MRNSSRGGTIFCLFFAGGYGGGGSQLSGHQGPLFRSLSKYNQDNCPHGTFTSTTPAAPGAGQGPAHAPGACLGAGSGAGGGGGALPVGGGPAGGLGAQEAARPAAVPLRAPKRRDALGEEGGDLA